MQKSFEGFMSDIKGGETRVDEMRAEWEKQNPGKPYPGSDGRGEQVGTREQPKEKGIQTAQVIDTFTQEAAETKKRLEAELQKPERKDWPPAKGNPEAEVALSKSLEAGLNVV